MPSLTGFSIKSSEEYKRDFIKFMAYCKREMKKYQELGTLKDASKDAYIEALGSINFDPAGMPLPDMSQLS